MSVNYIPDHILRSEVNPYYFIWAPISSALYNFKAAILDYLDESDLKADQIAKNTIKKANPEVELTQGEKKEFHYYSHSAAGALLMIPIFNIIPFSLLVIKEKEDWIPKKIAEEKETCEMKSVVLEKVNDIKPLVMKETTPLKNELTFPKKAIEPIQKHEPEKLKNVEFQIAKKEPIPLDETKEPEFKRNMSPRIQERIKTYKRNSEQPLSPRVEDRGLLKRSDSHHLKETHDLQKKTTGKYFSLFPEESSEEKLRLNPHNRGLPPTHDEMELVSKLFLNFPGELLRDKIENAHKNLESLQCFIDLKFKDVSRSLYIQKSYSHDVHVKTENNPYEMIRRGIFSLKNQDYLELLEKFNWTLYHDVIRVSDK